MLVIDFHLPTAAETSIALFDTLGRQGQGIMALQYLEASRRQLEVPVYGLPKGVYIVTVNADGVFASRRIAKR